MPAASLNPSDKTKELFSIQRLKLFYQDGDYIACFGGPSSSPDGWIINLPASHVFDGDFHALPYEIELNAMWAHTQARIRHPLSRYLRQDGPEISWEAKASHAGFPDYQHADLFRDVACVFRDSEQNHLALEFITKAHDLRPSGQLINIILHDLRLKCDSV